MAKGEPKAWITVRGRRVPIYDGESKADAVKRMTDKDARVKKKVDETFTSSRESQDKSHSKEIEASKAKQRSKAEDNLAGLRAELKKHPNDEHTEYIKKRIKAAEDRVKQSGGKTKYEKDETVYVRIPAKIAGVPNGTVIRAKIFSIKDDGAYMITSARYGLLRYEEKDIHKKRTEA